jgi:outer membrane protein OmpA-like peptidoglycan-associated protein
MVEETVGPGPLPRQHFSTTPVLLTSALGLCPVAETACPVVDERGWELANPAGRVDEATDRTTLWNFAVDAAALKPEHQQRLRDAAAALPSGEMVMVEGFASCSGSAAHNEHLARSRAETAVAFLRAQRPDLRIGLNYFGERTPSPPVTAGDGEAMARNRRVEIHVVNVARGRFGLPRFQLPTQDPLPAPPPPASPPTGSGAGGGTEAE